MTFRNLIETKFLQKIKKTGKHAGKSIEELEKEKAAIVARTKKAGKESLADKKRRAEIQFAINAKKGAYKKRGESVGFQKKCRPVLAESTVREMVSALLGETERKEYEEEDEEKGKKQSMKDKMAALRAKREK